MYEHKFTYYILWAVVALFAATGLTSCSSDDDPVVTPEEKKEDTNFYVSFHLITHDSTTRSDEDTETDPAQTPIDWENLPEESGTEDENYIDPSKLGFYLYNAADANMGYSANSVNWAWRYYDNEMKIRASVVVESTDGYYVLGKITGSRMGSNFQLAVYANVDDTHQSQDFNTLDVTNDYTVVLPWLTEKNQWVHTYTQGFTPSKSTPIPMFGIKNVIGYTFEKGKVTDIGSIKMMRSMAKIEVYAVDDTEISNVKLAQCHQLYYPAPYLRLINKNWDTNYRSSDNPPTELDVATDDYLNIPGEYSDNMVTATTPVVLTDVPATKITDETGKLVCWRMYVPEYRITGSPIVSTSSSKAANANNCIKVSINGADRSIYFRDYHELNNGTHSKISECTAYNILRNHIYRYYVSVSPSIDYMVESWDKYTADTIEFN